MGMRWIIGLAALACAIPSAAQIARPVLVSDGARLVNVEELSIDQLGAKMARGEASSVDLVNAYLTRIEVRDGPDTRLALRSVLAINPRALDEARASDARRKAGRLLGPLDGVPVLVKDNIETRDQPTTAGSLALKDNNAGRDAPVVARLRAAGAVILGKTNLSEWANSRSNDSMSGWSAAGGLVRNPYALDRTACGSSSGSGAAVAASFAAVALGTETDGSVVCPAAMNGLVGLKPTLGAVSRTHVVPLAHSQDTPGPMGRSVKDVAILYSAMVGSDPADAATRDADKHRRDYAAGLNAGALKGVRLGYWRPRGVPEALGRSFDSALESAKAAGATLVEVKMPKLDGIGQAEYLVLQTELKADLDAYLSAAPASVKTRTLDQVIAFNKAHAAAEMPFFGQGSFETAAKTKGLDDPAYKEARVKSLRMASIEGIDAMLKEAGAEVLITPSYGMPWLADPVHGDQFSGPSASQLPAVSGYPHLTVPMGLIQGLPVGLSFIGRPWSEAMLLGFGYAYEQQAKARVAPRYLPSVEADLGPQMLSE
jgi:amidase